MTCFFLLTPCQNEKRAPSGLHPHTFQAQATPNLINVLSEMIKDVLHSGVSLVHTHYRDVSWIWGTRRIRGQAMTWGCGARAEGLA